ncbi:MAG: MFS transporter, partial [Actinomycetales bacterium]|nr:MFS transporter [Actinomycetales bacterium]
APVYPAIIHSTPGNFGRRNSQAIIGIQMAAAYVGSTLAPPLFGVLSSWAGMRIFPVYIAALVVLGLVMSERLNRVVPSPSGVAAA